MCVQSSLYYQQWIDTWRSGFEQKTNSFLLAHWSKRQRSSRSWTYWLLLPRRARCVHSAWKKHQDAVFWVDINLAIQKRDWHSIKHDRMQPKISLRHDHDWTRGNDKLGSTVEQQPVDKLVQQFFGEVQHYILQTNLTKTQANACC